MLDKPDDGTIYYKDKDTKDIYRAELARLRRTEIAFVFQDYYLMDSLSIKENIMLPLILDEADIQESKKKCEEMAEKFAITDLLDKKPYELSGGEKQRTAICRSINLQSGFDFGGRTNRKSGLCLIRGCNTYFRRD